MKHKLEEAFENGGVSLIIDASSDGVLLPTDFLKENKLRIVVAKHNSKNVSFHDDYIQCIVDKISPFVTLKIPYSSIKSWNPVRVEDGYVKGDGIVYKAQIPWQLLFFLIPTYLFIAVIEILGRIHNAFGIILYFIIMAISYFLIIAWIVSHKILGENSMVSHNNLLDSFIYVCILSVIVIVSFSQLCRYSNLQFGNYSSTSNDFVSWLWYGIWNTVEGMLLDLPSIYEWNLSDIKPETFWSKAILLTYRTSAASILMYSIFYLKRQYNDNGRVHSINIYDVPRKYDCYRIYILSHLGYLILAYALSAPIIYLSSDHSIWQYLFAVFLFWFSLVNIMAVKKLNGVWNKAASLTIGSFCIYKLYYIIAY